MGAPPSTYGAALGVACGTVRRYPKLAHWIATGDQQAVSVLAMFESRDEVRAWLLYESYRRCDEHVAAIITKAHEFVHEGGQAALVVAAFMAHRDAGALRGLSPTRLAVHRAVFSLAAEQGAPVIASFRYLATAVSAQSDITRSHAVVGRHLDALERQGLLSYEPGQPGLHTPAATIHLDLPSTLPSTLPAGLDDEVRIWLALGPSALLALRDYRIHAQADRAKRSAAADIAHRGARAADLQRAEAERQRYIEHDLQELYDDLDNLIRLRSSDVPDYNRNFVTDKHRDHDLSSLKADVIRREHAEAAADRAAVNEAGGALVRALFKKRDEEECIRQAAELEEQRRLSDLYRD